MSAIRSQQGVVLVAAIFILVVLSMAVGVGLRLVVAKRLGSDLSIPAVQLRYIASAGMAQSKAFLDETKNCEQFSARPMRLPAPLVQYESELRCTMQSFDLKGKNVSQFTLEVLARRADIGINDPYYAQVRLQEVVFLDN